ncbi:DUF305 domain-containing protein [Leucobacter sp. HNU]|uniref:DUF305 domain-containing protein n=1 Tax=Leucobacter sp. HNU TaxID=3236805 RepID=UPI003A801D6C
MRFRTLALASGALATSLVLTGCSAGNNDMGGMTGMDHGSGTSTTAPTTTDPSANGADKMFVMMMIPHHQQAIEMADTILGKDGIDKRVTTLAQQIKDAQGPEIEKMKGWLSDWGTPYDENSSGGMSGMNHDMGGMMSDADMKALDAATGTEAAKLFLTGMIAHHEGAITMAQDAVKNGQDADVIALAQQVIDGQTAEIATMKDLIGSL